ARPRASTDWTTSAELPMAGRRSISTLRLMCAPTLRAHDVDMTSNNERTSDTTGDDTRTRLLAAMPVRERRMELAGISTAVLEGGDGPPVVLLHEQGEFAARWMRMIPDLVAGHRVVAPDLPGHGASF